MNYLTVVSEIREAKSSDGYTIPCNYINHPRFKPECKLCAGLHYVFIRFTRDRSYSNGYMLRTSINYLLDYASEFEKDNPQELHLTALQQLSAEVYYGFDMFIKRKNAPKQAAIKLKTALSVVARDNDEGMPLLSLPMLETPKGKVNEPLTKDCLKQLSDALKCHVDLLYQKLEYRNEVEKAEAYSYHEICEFGSLHTWCPQVERSIKTLILHDHPFVVSFDNFSKTIKKARGKDKVTHVVEQIYRRYNHDQLIRRAGATKLITLGELLESYYPTAIDQVAISIFIALQSGWNKETVMAIDPDNYEHVLTGALNTSLALIYSEKQKSQSLGKPYLDPKTFISPSSKDDKYSEYNLIKLAKNLSSPFAGLSVDSSSERVVENFNPSFQCMRQAFVMTLMKSRTGSKPGRFLSISNANLWRCGVKGFFEKYEIRENGRRFAIADDLNGRLRPTWIRFVRDNKKRPLSLVALQQGHKSIETTDVHYDSSGMAMQQRRERLRIELNDIAKLLRLRKFKGMIGKGVADMACFASFRIFTLPGYEKSLWACMDSFRPDWPDSDSRIPTGTKCSEINQCLFCSQVCIFEDSLPFLMERQSIIQLELQDYQERAFNSPLADELRIIEFIFDIWGDEQSLKQAARYMRHHPDMLPREMHSLSILFED